MRNQFADAHKKLFIQIDNRRQITIDRAQLEIWMSEIDIWLNWYQLRGSSAFGKKVKNAGEYNLEIDWVPT